MSISWFRHWHGLATDPKLAFVAKKCRRPMCEVVAVFVSMLENASANESERGTLSNWDHEVVGCSLDIEPMHVEAIYLAMQGKLILANKLMGWSRRQPKREDDSAERVRAHREKKRAVTQCNAPSHQETQDQESESEKDSELTSLPPEQDAAREKRKEVFKPDLVGRGGASAPKREMIQRAEGLGLPVDDLLDATRKANPRNPHAYFRTLAVNELARRIPRCRPELLSAAISGKPDAFTVVTLALMETADALA